jgi:hypothetical protein
MLNYCHNLPRLESGIRQHLYGSGSQGWGWWKTFLCTSWVTFGTAGLLWGEQRYTRSCLSQLYPPGLQIEDFCSRQNFVQVFSQRCYQAEGTSSLLKPSLDLMLQNILRWAGLQVISGVVCCFVLPCPSNVFYNTFVNIISWYEFCIQFYKQLTGGSLICRFKPARSPW